jgi:hypothetical protein
MSDPRFKNAEAAERAGDHARAAAAYWEATADADPATAAEAFIRLARLALRAGSAASAGHYYALARLQAVKLGSSELRDRVDVELGLAGLPPDAEGGTGPAPAQT